MKTSVEFAASLADFVDAVLRNFDACVDRPPTVAFRPFYEVDRETELKVCVVPAGLDVERTSRDSFKSTAVASISFQQYVGTPLDEERVAKLAEIVEHVQSQLINETIKCDDEDFIVDSVYCDALFDQRHLVESSLFTGVLTASASTYYWVTE